MAKQEKRVVAASVSVRDMPEVIADLRVELARLLREKADADWKIGEQNIIDISVRRALHDVAAAFEAGLTRVGALET